MGACRCGVRGFPVLDKLIPKELFFLRAFLTGMSALTPKADIHAALQYVCLVPIADMALPQVGTAGWPARAGEGAVHSVTSGHATGITNSLAAHLLHRFLAGQPRSTCSFKNPECRP